ncbi:Calx-beta domain-containing protein [Chromatium okenii]|uniref:beta strand repeat-containing protein n=1 Tax=Chromatium okenii TaxID=61644 RepID=UPI0026F35F39|nr:Calx-beta domain-containing protein [Chromatium okenii]MBV5309387.1 hypothetical protein [Chromatium okenii]
MTVRAFLGSNDSFTVANNNVIVTGSTGTEKVVVQAGIVGTMTDANVEQFHLSGIVGGYTFQHVAGVGLQIKSGATVVATIPSLNQTSTLYFADGSASLTQTGGSTWTLGASGAITTAAATFATTAAGFSTAVKSESGVTTVPTISLDPTAVTTVTEGNSGTTTMTFTAKLSAASANPVTVTYATANATALSPSDYTAASTTLTFAPGETSKSFTVAVIGDTTYEPTETFTVTLSNPSAGATLAATGTTATGTITNDDINILPVNTVPTAINAVSGQPVALQGISVTDTDNGVVTVNLSAANSVIAVTSPASVATGNGTGSLTLAGAVASINADLAKLTFSSGLTSAGTQTLTVTTTDPNGGTDTDFVTINVSQAYLLTTNTETLTGSTGDDTFTEAATNGAADFQAADSIDGGIGYDTLMINAGNTTPILGSRISQVEVYDVTAGIAGAKTYMIDATGNTQFSKLTLRDGDTTNPDSFTVTAFGTGDTLYIPAADVNAVTLNGLVAADSAIVTLGDNVDITSLTFGAGAAFANLTINTGTTGTHTIGTLSSGKAAPTNITVNGNAGLSVTTLVANAYGTITGGAGNDTISAVNSTSSVTMIGGAGNDLLTGATDATGVLTGSIVGGLGNDTLVGGSNADTINGGAGADSMTGGTGNDTFVFALGDGGNLATTRDVIADLNAGDKFDLSSSTFVGLTIADGAITTSAGGKAANGTQEVYIDTTNGYLVIETADNGTTATVDQIVLPTAFKNAPMTSASEILTVGIPTMTSTNVGSTLTLSGQQIGAAAAVIVNLSTPPTVNAVVVGTAAVTNVDASALTGFGIQMYSTGTTAGNHSTTAGTYTGSAQADQLFGSTMADTISGGAGTDQLIGKLGADRLTGGAGIDDFNLVKADSTLAAMDIITDFRAATGDNAGAADTITITDQTAVASGVNTTVLARADATFAAALDAVATLNATDLGLSVFTYGGNTYAYVETAAGTAGTAYVAGDCLIQIVGTPWAAGTAIAGLGINAI